MKFYLRGGVGDFLQTLWFVTNNPDSTYIIHTHFKKAKEFFSSFGVNNTDVYLFDTIEEHDSQVDLIVKNHGENSTTNIKEVPRAFYSTIDFEQHHKDAANSLVASFASENPIIGIHPFGSDFSAKVHADFNLPIKFIPPDVTEKLIDDDHNYLIFGSRSEIESYGVKESGNVKFVCFDNILTSLACVNHCCKFIGVDSCFKTLATNSKIPTFIILGDFEDRLRDSMFINQYEKDGVLSVFRYTNFDNKKAEISEKALYFIKNSEHEPA